MLARCPLVQEPAPTAAPSAAPGLAHPLSTLHRSLGNAALQELLLGRGEALPRFPHQAALTRSLGAPPGQAVVDPAACAARGVEAFTEGATTFFRTPAPSLAVAAHEAAHQLQHAGRSRDAGLGAEVHAEAVAARVERSVDARPLLSAPGDTVSGAIHDYTVVPVDEQGAGSALGWRAPGGTPLQLADDGRLAVACPEQGRTQDAWATSDQIQASNAVLEAQGAAVRLAAGPAELRGKAPGDGATERALSRVVVTTPDGAPATLTGDCGTAAAEVMGAEGRVSAAVARSWTGQEQVTDPHALYGRRDGAPYHTPEVWLLEILRMAYGADLDAARLFALYSAQTPDERDAFEKRYGVNLQAVPEVGEALTIGSVPADPRWTRSPGVSAEETYNWHFATCVFKSGDDFVTLESYAGRAPTDWYFSMWGPARYGQSFHEREAETGIFGTAPVSLVVTPSDALAFTVRLTEGADLAGDSELYLRVSTVLGSRESAVSPLAPGDTGSFEVSLAGLLPWGESQPLTIEVLEDDLLSDDALFRTTWSPPFTTGQDAGNGVEIRAERVP